MEGDNQGERAKTVKIDTDQLLLAENVITCEWYWPYERLLNL